jgi:hypothetical protein
MTALVIAIALCVTMLSACGSTKPKPYETVEKFADAYNRLDYNQLIECFDPRITKIVKGMVSGVASALGGVSVGDDTSAAAFSLVGDLLSEYATEYWDDKDVTCTMTVNEVATEMDGDNKAKVTAEITVESSDGDSDTSEETFSMVKVDDEWYITIGLSDITSLLGE